MISASPSDCRRRGIRSISGAQASSGATATACTGRPSRSTFAARGACVTTTTSCPAPAHARASGTSGSRCPEWPVVENRTRTRRVAQHVGAPCDNAAGPPCDSRGVPTRPPSRLRSWPRVLEAVYRGPLRRAQISFAAMWASESAFMVALAVVAFREGGVAAVGAVTAVRMATAALLAPFLATMADRVRRERVLFCVGVVRGAMPAGAAVVTANGGPPAVTYGFAVVATVAVSLYRPAHSALLPALAKSPQDLTS